MSRRAVENYAPFAIVQFDVEDENAASQIIEIIRSDWGGYVNDEGEITACFFPPTTDQNVIDEYLRNNESPDSSWSNDGELWRVKKFCSYSHNLHDAKKMLELYRGLSEVDTDDDKNHNKFRATRHSRSKKKYDSNYNLDGDEDENEDEDDEFPPLKTKTKFIKKTERSDSDDLEKIESKKFDSALEKKSASPRKSDVITESESDESIMEEDENRTEEIGPELGGEELDFSNKENECGSSPETRDKTVFSKKSVHIKEEMSRVPSNRSHVPTNNKCDNVSKAKKRKSSETEGISHTYNVPKAKKRKSSETEGISHTSNTDSFLCKKISSIDLMLRSLCKEKKTESRLPDSFLNKEGELKHFPINDLAKIDEVETKLHATKLSDILINALVNLGCLSNLSTTVSQMLHHIVTYTVGKQFCFEGKSKNKKPFKVLKLNETVQKAALMLYPNESVAAINGSIATWLTYCSIREQRELQLNNAQQAEAAETIDLDKEP